MSEFASLQALIGADCIILDDNTCRLYSEDIASSAAHQVSAIVRPTSTEMVSTILSWANDAQVPVLVRGGGMSYTGGYLPERAGCIMLDMTSMQSIGSASARSSVCVEAGCTWSMLYDALLEQNQRVPFFGPLSGHVATIGGAVAQNSAFFGSARYGTVQDQVIGMELVDGQGNIHWAGENQNGQFHQPCAFGDDWKTLLVGDAGVFGVKTRVVLKTMDMPNETRFLSFGFDRADDVLQSMQALQDTPHIADIYAFDKVTHDNLSRSGFSVLEAPQLARDLARQTGSLLKTAGAMIQGAVLGKVRLTDYAWSLHLVLEFDSVDSAEPVIQSVAGMCTSRGGTTIPDTIPRVTRARPFRSIRALVGPDGERWLPCHGVFTADRATDVMRKLASWLTAHSAELQKHDIRVSTLLTRVGQDVLVEPQFFWPDELSLFQKNHARAEQVRQFAGNPGNATTRQRVQQLRAGIRELFVSEDAGFMQLGKYYPWTHKYGGMDESQARDLKQQLDPQHILNPGVPFFQK